jgi:YVTN family beta-propeller protein
MGLVGKMTGKGFKMPEAGEECRSGGWRMRTFCPVALFILASFISYPAPVLAKHTASRIIYGPTQLYVTLKGLRQFYIIDRNDPTQVRKVPVDSPPCGGFITQNGRDFYVALGEADAIAVVDTQSNTVRAKISLKDEKGHYMDPGGMAVSPDGQTIFVANESGDSLSVVDLASRAVKKRIPMGVGPQDVAITPDGKSVYVTDFYSIRVVDTSTGTVTARLNLKDPSSDAARTVVLPDGEEVLRGPRDIVMAPDGKAVYAAIEDSGEIAIVETRTNRIRNLVKVGSYPGGLALSPDGRYLYIAHRDAQEISVLDTASERIVRKIAVGKDPWDITVSPDGRTVYVVNQGSSDVSIIDAFHYKVISTVALGAVKGIFPRGLRRLLFRWRKEKQKHRAKAIPFGAAVLVAILLAPLAVGISAPPPDRDHKIVFESRRSGNWEIYLMEADGTHQTRLTYTTAENRAPFWSPDGRKILFVSDRDGNKEVYRMNADGSEQRNLTRSAGDDFSPSWSPNGQWITYVSKRDGQREIYRMDPEGGRQSRLTSAGDNWNPNWSPILSGGPCGSENRPPMPPDPAQLLAKPESCLRQKVAFVSNRDGNNEIYLMNADGTDQENLTKNSAEDGRGSHSWSPDGSKIAWVTNRDGNWEIYVMNADGSKPVNVTRSPAEEGIGMFVWSPDSRQIAFISTRDGNEEVYTVNSDGTGSLNLSKNPAMDDVPLWSPDGRKVAFVSNRTGHDEIYVMDTDGRYQVQLTFTQTREDYPRWQP